MQRFKKWYRVRKIRRLGIYPCQTILHTLKFQDVLESNIMIKGIAIVKTTANMGSCNSLGDSKKHTSEYDFIDRLHGIIHLALILH